MKNNGCEESSLNWVIERSGRLTVHKDLSVATLFHLKTSFHGS